MDQRAFFAVLALFAFAASAHANQCPPYIEPEIIVTKFMAEPRFVNSFSLEQLKSMQEAEDPPELRVGGLTKMRRATEGKGVITFARLSDGTFCAQITQYAFDIAVPEVTVYVAREFASSTCSYNVVRDHELKHVDAARNFLSRFAEKAAAHLSGYFRQMGVVHARTEEEARRTIEVNYENLNKYLQNAGNELLTNTVDSPEETKRVVSSCDGEIKRIFEGEENGTDK